MPSSILSYEGETIASANIRKDYDDSCRRVLGLKQISARILKDCAEEFKDCTIDEIIACIGKVETGSCPVDRDSPVIDLDDTADPSIKEGSRYFDIRFTVRVPHSADNVIMLIVNIEAQRAYYTQYSIIRRGIYHCSRLISSQYGTVFTGDDFDRLRKVYSIWICTNSPEKNKNTIAKYSISKSMLVGTDTENDRCEYDLLSLVIIYLGKVKDHRTAPDGIIKLLTLIFSDKVKFSEMKNILENDFDLKMTREVNEEVERMCNLSEDIWENGKTEGEIKATALIINHIMAQGQSFDEAVCTTGISHDLAENVRIFIDTEHLPS